MNNKGGCAKTTTCLAVGDAWAAKGHKILYIDIDCQANLSQIAADVNLSDYQWESTILDAFVGGKDVGLPVVHTAQMHENIDLVPSDLTLTRFDSLTQSYQTREWLLWDLLEDVKDSYDFVLIDCPPAIGVLTDNALVASDYLVVVGNPDGLSYQGACMVVESYNKVIHNKKLNPELQLLGFVCTRYQKNKVSELFVEKYKRDFGPLFVEPVVRQSTKLVQAVSFHKTIYEIDPLGKATEDYLNVSEELLRRIK